MNLTHTKNGEILHVRLEGKLDATTSPKTEKDIVALLDQGEKRVVIDLSGLDYISSAGLRVLLLVAKRMKACQGRVVLYALQPQIREIFDIAGFTPLFPMVDTVAQAEELA